MFHLKGYTTVGVTVFITDPYGLGICLDSQVMMTLLHCSTCTVEDWQKRKQVG